MLTIGRKQVKPKVVHKAVEEVLVVDRDRIIVILAVIVAEGGEDQCVRELLPQVPGDIRKAGQKQRIGVFRVVRIIDRHCSVMAGHISS